MRTKNNSTYYVIGGAKLSREAIVHRYLHLVKYVAGRTSVHLPAHIEINDLINEGVVGLIDAIEKYDDARGVKFETYALTRIHGAIIDALRHLDWVPRAVRRRARELELAHQRLELELGRVPSAPEVARRLGVTADELDRLKQRLRGASVMSLEESVPNERGYDLPLAETLRDEGGDVVAELEHRELRTELERAVQALPQQERAVIYGYYFKNEPLKEIKASLGVSESRASQIHSQAVLRLRRRLRELRGELGYRDEEPGLRQKYVRGEVPGRSRSTVH
ncbi:MAG TPA: FliA/WhiG family RNA polymerase sigma factor [Candidatus Tumulicola sp.]|nr:FliA/WhiG family RNA polymerase sigma factor [Candidatus Tumulicola sp.]